MAGPTGARPWLLLSVMENFHMDTLKLERQPLIPLLQMGPLSNGRQGITNALMYQVKKKMKQ